MTAKIAIFLLEVLFRFILTSPRVQNSAAFMVIATLVHDYGSPNDLGESLSVESARRIPWPLSPYRWEPFHAPVTSEEKGSLSA